MDNRNYLSFRALLRHDMFSYVCFMLPLAMSILILPTVIVTGDYAPFLLGLLIVLLAIGAAALAARVGFVRSVYRKSLLVKGKVDSLAFWGRGWGRITYSYTLDGQRYTAGNLIVMNNVTTSFFPKQEVMVAVNPEKPKRAFVVELYQG